MQVTFRRMFGEDYGGTLVLKKIQTKEAWGGVGVDRLMELGEGREGNADPLEASRGLELERTEGPWHLDLFVVVNLLEAKFEWGLPRLAHTQIPEAALVQATRVPGPCVRSVPGVPGKPLSGSS